MDASISYAETSGAHGKIYMALKSIRSILILSFILLTLFSTLIPTGNVQALSGHFRTSPLPLLDTFVSQVKNGQADELRGVYIPETLAARIVQQPTGNNEFVSPRQGIATQFGLASKLGATGLLAHNYLAGESFSLLEKGQKFYLIYGNGRTSAFVVTEILNYQALKPTSTSSNFVDLENGSLLKASELFSKIYNRPGQVVFQTCVSNEGNRAWGRLFVIAEPVSQK
jgi:hypothetical protein